MVTFNRISSAIFDVLLAPFGYGAAAFDLLLWPIVMGIGALVVYKHISNQKAIAYTKSQISMHLLEIRLFNNDMLQVLKSTGSILVKNTFYIGHNLLPMLVLTGPMVAVMVQLVAHFAYAPSPVGATEVLRLQADVPTLEASLEVPEGIELEATVRTADGQVFWRIHAENAGDHELVVHLDGDSVVKTWAVGGEDRKVPVKRLRSIESFLYPGELAIPAGSPIQVLELTTTHTRELPWLPDGEVGILGLFLVVSLVAGFALKDVFGVTL